MTDELVHRENPSPNCDSRALPIGELSSRTAPAAMIHQLAASVGGGVQWALSDDALVMGAVLPQA